MAGGTTDQKEKVCVTGAGGFTGSWLVNLLLSKDYVVHGTVRQPGQSLPSLIVYTVSEYIYVYIYILCAHAGDSKYDHLNKLEKASENLKLFKADLLDYDSLRLAIEGCSGVFHVASPIPTYLKDSDPEARIFQIMLSIKGTLNVLKACKEAKVKRVVVVSSLAAVVMNLEWPKDQVKDENCWSVPEYMKTTKKWYYLSKTEAEREALEFGKRNGLEVVTVCPSLILGPILQSTRKCSSFLIVMTIIGISVHIHILRVQGTGHVSCLCNINGLVCVHTRATLYECVGDLESLPCNYWTFVDVRDLAEALLLAYKKSEAAGERYICHSHSIGIRDVPPEGWNRGLGKVDRLLYLYCIFPS
ncbi:cinnamoyl-CoA reductase 2-like [Pyrus ussuriensis x Pyrus communis]|uniref:Cinnamoyl-CoA reductase 2-like n=1 Tax=Pyrus ussuriensis x Pyrus communis TaxID=2448454 RepID=A0A5N5HYQ8_9ROSA|nr:cinnamoyl-CoA reductase 2-like [Pyrus ussuriensis x Pyrus communis]